MGLVQTGAILCMLMSVFVHSQESDFISTTNIVSITITGNLKNIKYHKNNIMQPNKNPSSTESMIIEGQIFKDLNDIKAEISKYKPVFLIRASMEFESKIALPCYYEQLFRLAAEQLDTSLLLLGKLSPCSAYINPINTMIKRVFVLSLTQIQLGTIIRDLVYAEQHVWKEAVIIYDKSNAFSKFRSALESTDNSVYLRQWQSDKSQNVALIKNFLRVRTFILDMNQENVKAFFILATGLKLLDSMFTNLIVIDQDNIAKSIQDFSFTGANITVIRPTLNDNISQNDMKEFSQKVSDMFSTRLLRVISNPIVQSNINKEKPNFVSPSIWIPQFNLSNVDGPLLTINENQDYQFDIKFETVHLGEKKLTKISDWTNSTGFIPIFKKDDLLRDRFLKEGNKKTIRVTTVEDRPFVMFRRRSENGQLVSSNDEYHGLAIDILKRLSVLNNFTYTIHLVKDGKFGSVNSSGHWNGMIGELINNEADLALASLTITSQRERVIDFTIPWMTSGISILIRKPNPKSDLALLQFMQPLSFSVWLMVLVAYIVVSLTLFVVGRITPYEWYNKASCQKPIENQFSFSNSFWYAGSILHQGCNICPRATSTRIISTAWWFFIIIIVCYYIANITAFHTITSPKLSITNVEDLAKQTKIKYGCVSGGSTYAFFQKSQVSLYRKMGEFMRGDPSSLVSHSAAGIQRALKGDYAFFLESPINEYTRYRNCDLMKLGGDLNTNGWGIGVAAGNTALRDSLSEGILKLQKDQSLENIKNYWFRENNVINPCTDDNSLTQTYRTQLGLDRIGGVFCILLILLTISCLVSCVEMVYWASRRAVKRRGSNVIGTIDSQLKKVMGCAKSRKSKTSADVHIPCTSLLDGILCRDRIMKYSSVQNLKYSCFCDDCLSLNVLIPPTSHKVTPS